MDALSRLLMLNAPQRQRFYKNCVLGSDWQLPHGAGQLSVIRWHALTQGAAKLEMPTERFLHYAREMWSCYHKIQLIA
ncbi:hypothetical protein ACTMQE_19625 [Escherichia coli]